jgi:glycosyltransferase involved in cell wall biosynthesis
MFDPAADGQDFRRQHSLESKYVALYAGAHGMSNDLEVLLEAAGRLIDQPEVAIVLLGDGKEKPHLQALASEKDLNNVFFIPSVPKDEMSGALAAADACIAILKPVEMYKTVYPNKVFDYMAAGRPVILAIDGVIRDVVESAQCGIVVPPGDAESLANAIQLLAKSLEQGLTLGQNGRRYVETYFDRAVVAEKLNQLLESILKEGN